MKGDVTLNTFAKKSLSIFAATMVLTAVLAGCASGGNASSSTAVDTNLTYPAKPEELGSGTVKWTEEETADGWAKVTNEGGATLGYTKGSGLEIIQLKGLAFKDHNKNGMLDLFEDWRQDAAARAADLSKQLTADELIGLIPHASQFDIDEDGAQASGILDQGVRTILSFATAYPADTQAKWNNSVQAHVEALGSSIPVNLTTNPRTTPVWPDNLALAATFDPELVLEISKGLSQEYRAVGVSTLLGPQIDLATEPRWARIGGTFGEDPALTRDMTNASVSGHQSTYDGETDMGWGNQSVNAMIKHWPGDGAGESGRESHDWYGQFTVYPGGQFETHLIPFVDGGFTVTSKTGSAAAIMDSYAIAWSEDGAYGDLVGSAFSEFKSELAASYGFDGLICSDWGVVSDPESGFSTGWGVDELGPGERVLKAMMAGTDQIGGMDVAGLDAVATVKEAYDLGVSEYGEEATMERFQSASEKILKTFFQVNLFENPYVSVAYAKEFVGGEESSAAGFEAQVKSIVMLKNDSETIQTVSKIEKPTVYVPMTFTPASVGFRGSKPAKAELPVDEATLSEYFTVVTDKVSETLTGPAGEDGKPTVAYEDIIRATKEELAECDYAIVIAKSPANLKAGLTSAGYDPATESVIPIALQYGPYTADSAAVRDESIAGPMTEVEVTNVYGTQHVEEKMNLSYKGKSSIITNTSDLDMILYAAENMPEEAKVIVAVNASNPMIFTEFDDKVDAIIMGFGINNKAFLEIATGKVEPSGLLPIQMPKNMEAVEAQLEDVPRDMEVYVDASGNSYDFAYGLNWAGVIKDARTEKYNVPALVSPEAKPAE